MSRRDLEKLAARTLTAQPARLQDARRGGQMRYHYYGHQGAVSAGHRGGVAKFLLYGSEGMRAMIRKYWDDVRAGRRPRRTNGKDAA